MSLWNSILFPCQMALMIFLGVHGWSMERAANRNVSIQKDARDLPNASRPFQSSRPIFPKSATQILISLAYDLFRHFLAPAAHSCSAELRLSGSGAHFFQVK